MSKTRCLGLVGGLGVGASVHYYQSLAKAHQKHDRTMDIVITHAETSRIYDHVQAGDRDGLADYLVVLFNESNTDFPHIDCAALHIQAIFKRLL